MVARAFLRCIGKAFTDDELLADQREPVDIAFGATRFQITSFIGGRKCVQEWRVRQRRYENAKQSSDVTEPWTASSAISFQEVSRLVAESLTKKASHYGFKNCSDLDVLVNVDLTGRHLWPLTPGLDARSALVLEKQGWRSVSMLFLPHGAVLATKADAPSFLRDRVGFVLSKWPNCDGWFDA